MNNQVFCYLFTGAQEGQQVSSQQQHVQYSTQHATQQQQQQQQQQQFQSSSSRQQQFTQQGGAVQNGGLSVDTSQRHAGGTMPRSPSSLSRCDIFCVYIYYIITFFSEIPLKILKFN